MRLLLLFGVLEEEPFLLEVPPPAALHVDRGCGPRRCNCCGGRKAAVSVRDIGVGCCWVVGGM